MLRHKVAFSWILGGTTDALLNRTKYCSNMVFEDKCGSAALAAEHGQVGRIRGVVTHLVAAPLGIPANEAMVRLGLLRVYVRMNLLCVCTVRLWILFIVVN